VIGRRLPLLALAYAAGTACGLSVSVPLQMILIPAGGLLVGGFLLSRIERRGLSVLFFALAAGLIGWAASRRARDEPLPDDVARALAANGSAVVTVEGVVRQDPDYGRRLPSGRTVRSLRMRTDRLDLPRGPSWGWDGTLGVRWYSRGRDAAPAYGERWLLHGRLRLDRRPGGEMRPVLSTGGFNAERLAVGSGSGFVAGCLRGRRHAADRLGRGIEDYPQAVAVMRALLLGYREQLDNTTRNLFASTGALHLFAISGLHVGMVCGFLIFLLCACRVSRVYWVLLLGPLLAAYTVATGAKPSAVRACLMAVLYFAAPLMQRKPDPLSAVAAAAILILAWQPAWLLEAGFVFSFTVVAGILVFCPGLLRVTTRLWHRDPLRVQEESLPVRLWRNTCRYLVSLACVSVAAWIGSVPLMAWYFGRVSPIALLSNILLIPLAFLTVLSGCLSVVLGACLGVIAEIFNHAALALVTLLLLVVRTLDAVPFGCLEVSRPPLVLVLGWYLLVAMWALRGARPAVREIGF